MPDQSTPRPAGLDALLDHVAANLPDKATTECAAALAPLTAKAREHQARHDAQVRAAATHQAATTVRTDADIRATEGEADLAAYGRELADLIHPESAPASLVELRIPRVPHPATAGVLAEVAAERNRQNEKWGEQNHPDGTGDPGTQEMADIMRGACQAAAARGELTWNDVLTEEIAEANAESDLARLCAELVQIAAVAVAWAEAIDRRGGER